jgi:DNA helicase IV
VAEDVRRQREDAGGAPSDADTTRVARSPAVRDWVDAVWPDLSATGLLIRLYAEPGFLGACARGVLDEAECAALYRAAPRTAKSAKWTPADVVLLDELDALLHGTDTFVHAVVDEAQDLSPMQCRAVARRCPLGSLTVLGDLAQATTPWAPGSWPVTLEHLGHDAVIQPLTVGYRVPGEVLELANRLLPHIAADVPPASSVRPGVGSLSFGPRDALLTVLADALAVEGSVGVIVADPSARPVLAELRAAGVDAHLLEDEVDPRVTVVPAASAKGLEFDTVLLLEPADIVATEPSRVDGLRRLYVVLTRAVSRLAVLHDAPLPAELS